MAAETRQVAPIWSQIVVWTVPQGFASAFTQTRGGSYLQEFVPRGQSVQDWQQMITVTARAAWPKGEGMRPRIWPEIGEGLSGGLPARLSRNRNSAPVVDGAAEVVAGHLSCAALPGAGYGEAMVFIVARAGPDVFTFQWPCARVPVASS